jgi:hypothetical protein
MGREAIERALRILGKHPARVGARPACRDVLEACGLHEPDEDFDSRCISREPSPGADWLPDELILATRSELEAMLSEVPSPS